MKLVFWVFSLVQIYAANQFEYAQVQVGLQKYSEAITGFKDRINQKGDAEEVWYSKYMIGFCYEEMGDWEKALSWYLDAFQTNPDRGESLQKISSYYRHHGQNDLSH